MQKLTARNVRPGSDRAPTTKLAQAHEQRGTRRAGRHFLESSYNCPLIPHAELREWNSYSLEETDLLNICHLVVVQPVPMITIHSHAEVPTQELARLADPRRGFTSEMPVAEFSDDERVRTASRGPLSPPVPKCLGFEAAEKRSNRKRKRSARLPLQQRASARQKFLKSSDPRPTQSKSLNADA